MKTRLNNHHGYVMSWILIVFLVCSILVLAVLSMTTGYHNKVMESQYKTQAYYTARSVAELAVSALTTPKTENNELLDAIRAALEEGKTRFELEVKGLDKAMGTCILRISSENEDNLLITAASDCQGFKSLVEAVLYRETQENSEYWKLEYYRKGRDDEP